MKVAIDISPLTTGHMMRGIGSYTKYLTDELKRGENDINFEFFENPTSPPPADVVHYPYFDLFFRTLPIKKTAKRVVTVHDVIPLIFPNYFPSGIKGYVKLFFQKNALKKSNAIICDSVTSKNDIIAKLLIPKEKIHVIYLAPGPKFKKIEDNKKLLLISKKFDLPKKFILYVGDVNWNKNVLNLVEAIKIAKVNLVGVGQALTDNNLVQTQEVNRQIRKFSVSHKFIKTGYVDEEDLVAIYNLAALTILPSYYEGFGLQVLESMACGTPVVCSDNSSISEIGKPSAIFCDPTNPKDIAKKINQVLNLSAKQRQNLSQKSIDHASKFTWQKVAQETIKVYKSVV